MTDPTKTPSFAAADLAVFGPDDMSRGLCVLCGGMDAHLPACYDHPEHREEMHRYLCDVRERVEAALEEVRARQHRATAEACAIRMDAAAAKAKSESATAVDDEASAHLNTAAIENNASAMECREVRDSPPPPLAGKESE